jgi:hypothetical protein
MWATSGRLDFGDDLFGFGFAGGDVGFQGFLEQIALFGVQRFALGAEAEAAQLGEFKGERLDFGFGVFEGGIQPKGFGGLLLELVKQRLNGDVLSIGLAVIGRVEGVGQGRFRARIHALNFNR